MTARELSIARIRARLRHAPEAGFTIIEVMVALVVFAVIATACAYGLVNGLLMSQNSRARESAMALASQDLDAVRLSAMNTANGILNVASIPVGSPQVTTLGGTKYSLTRSVAWVNSDGTTGSCGSAGTTLAYKTVTTTVSWSVGGPGSNQSVSSTTAFAPSSNITSDSTGTLIVAVIGATGQPVPNLSVTIAPNTTNPNGALALMSAPSATNSDGCSYGLSVVPGNYDVSVTMTAGTGIDSTNKFTTPVKTIAVTAGQNVVVNFSYDAVATFPLTYPSGAEVASNMKLTMLAGSVGSSFANAPTSVLAFPLSAGYRPIAGAYVSAAAGGSGTCVDPDPASWPTAGDGAVSSPNAAVAASAGQTAATTAVPMGVVSLTGLANNTFLTAVNGSTSGTDDPGCSAAQTLTFARGGTARTIALPYGTWTLYTGSSSGALTTNVVSVNAAGVTVVGRGSVNSSTKTVTLDPRALS